MPFHVEVRRSFHRARAFNLNRRELESVLEPWRRGAEVELGDRRWEPRESRLTVLEGPALGAQELAFGQGWQNAVKSAEDVTAPLLRGTAASDVALLAQTQAGLHGVASMLESLELRAVGWSAAPPEAAVIVAGDAPELSARHAFQAGVAIGALGSRAIVVQLGTFDVPAELGEHAPIPVEADGPAPQALVERLRAAGYGLGGD